MTKTAEKPYPFGASHCYIAHIREYPPWGVYIAYKSKHEKGWENLTILPVPM